MKKVLSSLLIMFVFLLGTNNVKALDVSQVSLKVEEKSTTITVIEEGIGTLEINPKIEFNEVGDYITYKLVLKNNDGKKYKIESVTDNNTNEHIKVEYDYNKELNTENKEILITLKYDKKITDPSTELKSISVKIKLIDEEDKTEEVNINGGNDKSGKNNEGAKGKNPQTGDNIQTHVWWLFISLIGLVLSIIYLIKNKGKKYNKGLLSILLLLTLIPTIVFASEMKEITFNINFNNIKINIRHKVEFDTKGGNEIDTQVIDNNEKAMKPSNPEKTGYNFVKWLDKNGNEYTDDSLFYTFKKDTSLTAVWKMHEGVIAKPGNMAQSILSIKDTTGDVLADDDPDGNLRYYGNCANNYVNFNNQRWRIIGVFDVDDGSGNIESRVKLVREGNINGVWDTSDSSVNSGQGINQWGPSTYTNGDLYEGSDLMRLLNDHYLKYDDDTTKYINWYSGDNNEMKYKYYYRNGIKPEYLSYIDNALWYTGAIDINDNSIVSNRNFTANNVYAQESGNKVGDKCKTSQDSRYAYYTYCNDRVNRTTTWVGKVGLMYLSDYAYTGGGRVNGREACFKENLYTATNTANSVAGAIYNDNNGCISKGSWLYESYSQSMFLNPFAYSSYAIYNMHKGQFGTINLARASNYEGRPAVYLKSDVKITGGDGTILNPYTITR